MYIALYMIKLDNSTRSTNDLKLFEILLLVSDTLFRKFAQLLDNVMPMFLLSNEQNIDVYDVTNSNDGFSHVNIK